MPFLPDVVMLGQLPLTVMALTGLAGGAIAYVLTRGSAAADLLLDLILGGVLGAKLIYVLMDLPGHIANPAMLILFPYGPLALPGAVVGAAALAGWSLRKRADRLTLLDQTAVPLALGLAIAVAGWKAPGSWAFAPALGAAALGAWLAPRQTAVPGARSAQTVVILCFALVLADLARPGSSISGLQVAAASAGTLAWLWGTKGSAMKKDSGL